MPSTVAIVFCVCRMSCQLDGIGRTADKNTFQRQIQNPKLKGRSLEKEKGDNFKPLWNSANAALLLLCGGYVDTLGVVVIALFSVGYNFFFAKLETLLTSFVKCRLLRVKQSTHF